MSWLVNPWLLFAGLAAMSLPILIHLLNRRRYRIVDWAAMEFLLAAEKRNRRRIRLENLSLLVLRCLAVFLLGLLVARPFIPSGLTAGLLDAARLEHVVVLDDSLSMQAQLGTETAFDRARRRLLDLIRELADQRADHSLTLILTSRPEEPLVEAVPLQNASLAQVTRTVEGLQASDRATQLQSTLAALADDEQPPAGVQRLVYVFSDLRQADWSDPTVASLRHLAERAGACTIVDCAEDDDRNLSMVELKPEGQAIAGQPLVLDVAVKNQGTSAADNVRVRLTAGQSLPLENTIARLAPQETTSVRFSVPLAPVEAGSANALPPQKITVRLETPQQGADDRLAADSTGYFAARTIAGIRVLLVDGDPSSQFGKSESFYLRRALAPEGPIFSGVLVDVVSEADFEPATIAGYDVVFLLNVFRLGDQSGENLTRLAEWVSRGGGLVLMPGDRVEAALFNAQLWAEGQGPSPLRLGSIAGDESRTTWAGLQIEDANHPLTRQFAGNNNPLLAGLKVFRWWHGAADNRENGVAVLARLTNPERSPAIVHRRMASGHVLAFCLPADDDWHNWPAEPSYVLLMQDLVRYMAASRDVKSQWLVGQRIRESIDITEYDVSATLAGPLSLEAALEAAPTSQTAAELSAPWEIMYPADTRGFYELQLQRRSGGRESRLAAVNVDAAEGDLKRVETGPLADSLAAAGIRLVRAGEEIQPTNTAGSSELWRSLLAAVVVLLFAEQALGWHLGRKRS